MSKQRILNNANAENLYWQFDEKIFVFDDNIFNEKLVYSQQAR